jgi:hypothetical protein
MKQKLHKNRYLNLLFILGRVLARMAKLKRTLTILLCFSLMITLLPFGSAEAATELPASSIGQVLDTRQMELAPEAVYKWYDMKLDRGLEKVHTVEFNPTNPNLELQAGTKGGKVYGMQGVTKQAQYADKEGNRVIAGVNGDFYDLANYGTGVPGGLFMGNGKILNSTSASYDVFALNADGTSMYVPNPKLVKTVTINGVKSNLTHINRYRDNNQLVLYTLDYADSTKTNNLGDEVVLDVLNGEVKNGQTMQLKVSEIRKDQGNSPLSEGKVVLSAQGSARDILAGLQVGDEVTTEFSFPAGWENVDLAMSGRLLIKDGVVLQNVDPAGVHPRTAIGTKADGTIIMMEVDGRLPNFSEGLETKELGQIMKDLGVVNALNLDGGGSSTFIARLPGETTFKMINTGSDGGERLTGNSLLLVNKAPAGPATKLVVQPNMERVLASASVSFQTTGVNAAIHPASFADTPAWSVDPQYGTIDSNGTFTAANKPGTTEVHATAGSLSGTGEVEVVTELTELKFPDAAKAIDTGAEVQISVTGLRNGQVIIADSSNYEWSVEGDIGTINSDGVFTATTQMGITGKIIAKYGNVQTSMNVNVGTPPQILEDFEGDLSKYFVTKGANFNKSIVSITSEDEYVRFGKQALKLEYDFIGKIGTTGAYLQSNGSTNYLRMKDYPETLGMWVYGDGSGNWLRAQVRDKDGTGGGKPIDLTPENPGVNWKGWKYVEAPIPKGLTPPLALDLPVRLMTTSKNPPVKGAGAIYVDNIRALYGPATDDFDAPILKDLKPAEGSTVKTSLPTFEAIGEDAGFDRELHPGTTLIDPNKISFYVDDMLVPHTLYPPEGRISYKPSIPLADGIHKAKIKVRDLSGNRTEKEWTFTVDTGSSKFVYNSPNEIYGGITHSLDIKGSKVAGIHSGQIGFDFDMSKVENLQLVRGNKLSEDHVQADIDQASGAVLIKFTSLNAVSLTDDDLLGQIQYRVKPEVEGTHTIAFQSGSISFVNSMNQNAVFFGLPLHSAIKHQLKVSWDYNGNVEGYPTKFTVLDENGQPVEGAKVLADSTEIGVTDAQGKLTTNELTKEIKSYKIQVSKGSSFSSVMPFSVSKLAGTISPYNISVNMGADPTTSRGFNWHTHPNASGTVVEVAEKSGFVDFSQSSVIRTDGTDDLNVTYDIGTIRVHKANVTNLKPGTEYLYRVGDENGNFSAQGSFKTASKSDNKTSFLFFPDSQAADKKGYALWGNTVSSAVNNFPQTDFMVHAGDMVDTGYSENQWNMWFEAAQPYLMNTTMVAAIGNHEVMGTNGNNDFLNHFNQPGNGLNNLKGTSFSYDYNNVHFVVLNSESDYAEQKEWLRKDLASTDKAWKVVFFHRGPYGSIYDTEKVRKEWVPVFDEFNVDLVMNGHDHIYLRNVIKNNAPAQLGEGTAYVVGGTSGPKFYSLTSRDWTQIADEEQTQMYQAVTIDGNTLSLIAKTVPRMESGELNERIVDSFTLEKSVAQELSDVTLNGADSLIIGQTDQTVTTSVTVLGESSELKQGVYYDSSDKQVATVDQTGLVQAINEGTTVITTTYQGKTASYQLTVKKPSTNANIQSLQVSKGHLKFNKKTSDYTVQVGYSVNELTVTATPEEAHSTVKINSETVTTKQVPLNSGDNQITVEVIAQDGITTMTYKLIVKRASSNMTDSESIIPVTNEPLTITVPFGTKNVKAHVSPVTVGSKKEAILPLMEINSATSLGNVELNIPADTKISGPNSWDGTINLPELLEKTSLPFNHDKVEAVIEVGSMTESLILDKAVRLLLPNQGGKLAGYVKNDTLMPITDRISEDTQAAADQEIAAGGDAVLTVGNDLVIWTKHFTKFVVTNPSNSQPDIPKETNEVKETKETDESKETNQTNAIKETNKTKEPVVASTSTVLLNTESQTNETNGDGNNTSSVVDGDGNEDGENDTGGDEISASSNNAGEDNNSNGNKKSDGNKTIETTSDQKDDSQKALPIIAVFFGILIGAILLVIVILYFRKKKLTK